MGETEPTRKHNAGADPHGRLFPGDFSDEEALLASELRELFAIEREELPPYYISTLATNDRYDATLPGFEQKLSYRVFRDLRLPRLPLFHRRWLPVSWSTLAEVVTNASRPLVGAVGALMLLMLFSMVMASPSFAAGLRILLRGGAGVDQVSLYPKNIAAPGPVVSTRVHASTPAMPISWLGPEESNYSYQGMWNLDQQDWSKGPIAELQYAVAGATDGTGIVDIREFQVSDQYAAVLQVVQAGSAASVDVGGTPGVYVDGMWLSTATEHAWQSDTRSELIFARGGVIFWIVGDQRDGIGQAQLTDIAAHLAVASGPLERPGRLSLRLIGNELASTLHDPIEGEIYALVPQGVSPESGVASFVLMRGRSHPNLF